MESSFASKPNNFNENVRQTDTDLEYVRERKRGRPRKNLQIQEKISNVSELWRHKSINSKLNQIFNIEHF